jgi:hypothetical protein
VNSRMLLGGRVAAMAAATGAALLCASAVPGPAASAAVSHRTTRPAHSRPATASDKFWEGSDSWPMTVVGSAPYEEPGIGHAYSYGGYIGMAGNWAYQEGCHGQIAWSPTNSQDANVNYSTYHKGIGTGVYWFEGGPGVDPHYNGTTAEATAWGAQQAEWTLADMSKLQVIYPVVFEDVELPGIAPAPDNGWNSVYTSPCSGRVKQSYIPTDVDRAVFNGYANYITSHSKYKVGVYSSPGIWTSIFGTGPDSLIPNTYEWTYQGDTSSLSRVPDSQWCLPGTSTCADFFGGQKSSSPYALMWQWSGGGGTRNGYGDFDEIDGSRTP